MIRHLQIAGFALAWVCALAGTLHAEKSPRSTAQLANESDLILVGTIFALKVGVERSHVETGFGNYDWAIDLTIGIQNIEKGQYNPDETIVVRCFKIKSRKSLLESISVSGNEFIPAVGQDVRAHLYRKGGFWRVVYPNGLVPVSNDARLVDAAATPVPYRSTAFTYWLPLELWIFISGCWAIPILIRRLNRRFRRRHAVG
jgi:hypothetical protein